MGVGVAGATVLCRGGGGRVFGPVQMRYLVRVAEFTDLPGDQVSLVVLHLHGVDVLLPGGDTVVMTLRGPRAGL